MKVIILNYEDAIVNVATVDKREDIERYLTEDLNYDLDAIAYMALDEDRVPVYAVEGDLLTDRPLAIL